MTRGGLPKHCPIAKSLFNAGFAALLAHTDLQILVSRRMRETKLKSPRSYGCCVRTREGTEVKGIIADSRSLGAKPDYRQTPIGDC